ncbi:class A beta-lactamase, subclass A2 [Flavobacterium sp.]|uniref:class A beta-lactamase, subclass A2 n=1 Tax=Flavobacterium sp. TaxID=239 RepID=UPI0025C34DBA|nr:class A beta-lactamase, subclass A2 [Flavobacterium sp.]MBA4154710.1 class A beta-lactamase [Flavobacterium sp.]
MRRLFFATILLFLSSSTNTVAQTNTTLQQQVQAIVSGKNALVGIEIVGPDGKAIVSLNNEQHYPMQSVFKFHIALVVLSEIDKGKLALDQPIKIQKEELLPGLYSPLREKYPNGGTLPLSKILSYTVSLSDNVGCDVLLRLVGGPNVVEDYFKKNIGHTISIKLNEEQQQGDWELQFQNWTTPQAANQTLASFYYNKPQLLSKKSHDFLWQLMRETETGPRRIKGLLPKNTVVAHKTGTSGVNKKGMMAAVNDIGVVFLPNGKPFFISVFVTNTTENEATNEKIIAAIAKAAWDHFTKKAE